MKRLLLLFNALLFVVSGAMAQIPVGPSTGQYWKGGAATSDAWAPNWKSTAKATDGTSLLEFYNTGANGMNTSTGDLYADTYTLEVPTGYLISSYTFNGTATSGDVTITPYGESGTTISSGNALGTPLSVTVRASSTTFVLSGSGHIESLSLVVTVTPIPVIIANCPNYTTSAGCSHSMPSVYGTFSGQTYTTKDVSNMVGVTVTASAGLTIGEQEVTANNYGKCFKLETAAASTDYTVTMTAPTGYVITGYYLGCSANTKDAVHTLTSADGSVSVVASAPPYNSPANQPKAFEVTGLNTNSTSFTINTASKPNTLYLPLFYIYIAKSSEVVNDTYNVMFNGSQVATKTVARILGTSTSPSLPSSLQKSYCSYEYYSNSDCTTPLSSLTASASTIYVKCTCTYPFTVSSSFATATWYYATLNGKNLRADDDAKDGSGRYQTSATNGRIDEYKWAFFGNGNPYDNLYVMNKAQGNGKYLYQSTQPAFQSIADPTADNNALWAVSANSNGGFSLRSISGGSTWYINDAGGTGNLGYWNDARGANAAGSNWVVEEANTSDKALLQSTIDAAENLVVSPGVPGYLSVAAASTLSSAITTAQAVYDDKDGDWAGAASTLESAISTAYENIVYTPRTDVYYTITSARGSMVYDSSHSAQVDSESREYLWYTNSLDATNVDHLWGFIEQDGHYYMYNVGKQQFATVTTSGGYQLNDKGTWAFSNTPAYVTFDAGIDNCVAVPSVRIRATIATTGSTYSMSISTSYVGPVITYDAKNDGGIPMTFAESPVAVDDDITDVMTSKVTDLSLYRTALQDVIDVCEATVGSGLNQYASNSAYETALSAANTEYESSSATMGSLQDAKSDLETAYSALSLNMPSTGKFYRIQGAASTKYLAAGFASNNKFNMTTATDATTIFYYDSDKHLTNLSSGRCNGVTTSAWDWVVGSSASTVTFKDGLNNGGYAIQTATAYFYDNGDNSNSADRGGSISNMASENVRYRSWYLTEITSLPITIKKAAGGWASFYSPVALTIPDNGALTVYYVSNLSRNEATLTEITGVIPANTAVLMNYAGIESDQTLSFATTTTATTYDDYNLLEGSVTATSVNDDDMYTLQVGAAESIHEGVPGLYPKNAGTLAGFKAYLPASALDGVSVKGLSFRFEDATGITRTEQVQGSSEYFNLSGQRVQQPTRGLYIVNGKKVIIK